MRTALRAACRGLARVPLALLLLATLAAAAGAQGGRRTFLYVNGLPLTVTGTTAAHFDAGFVSLGALTFTVDLTANTPNFSPRRTRVAIRCTAPCPATGTLPAGALQWRRGDLGTWTGLTTAFAFVEERLSYWNGANDPWSNTVEFRYLLSWTGTPPTPTTQFRVELQLTVTAP